MNENISDDEGGDSIDPFDPNVTDQDNSDQRENFSWAKYSSSTVWEG